MSQLPRDRERIPHLIDNDRFSQKLHQEHTSPALRAWMICSNRPGRPLARARFGRIRPV